MGDPGEWKAGLSLSRGRKESIYSRMEKLGGRFEFHHFDFEVSPIA